MRRNRWKKEKNKAQVRKRSEKMVNKSRRGVEERHVEEKDRGMRGRGDD